MSINSTQKKLACGSFLFSLLHTGSPAISPSLEVDAFCA